MWSAAAQDPAPAPPPEQASASARPATVVYVEEDAAASARKQALDGSRTIPVVVIDGEVIRGFSPKRFEAALAKKRPQGRR